MDYKDLFFYGHKDVSEHFTVFTDCTFKKDIFVIRKIFHDFPYSAFIKDVEHVFIPHSTHFFQVFFENDNPDTLILDNTVNEDGDTYHNGAVFMYKLPILYEN